VTITPAGKGGGTPVSISIGHVHVHGTDAAAADAFVDMVMNRLSRALRRAGMEPEGAIS
jgi:hypothetical protein